jgi:ubiquinone/menaquinone biosynthesis C-methylase UbiE
MDRTTARTPAVAGLVIGDPSTGLDPAAASLAVARLKPGAEHIHWIHGDASALPELHVDLVTMTGTVAQVFLTEVDWADVLAVAHRALRPDGALVFETRRPGAQGWKAWTRGRTERRVDIPGAGVVHTWTELVEVASPLVSFQTVYVFEADGARLVSESTLRFRNQDEIVQSLSAAGFRVQEVREAPDRPGLGWCSSPAKSNDRVRLRPNRPWRSPLPPPVGPRRALKVPRGGSQEDGGSYGQRFVRRHRRPMPDHRVSPGQEDNKSLGRMDPRHRR